MRCCVSAVVSRHTSKHYIGDIRGSATLLDGSISPRTNTKLGENDITYRGSQYWNILSDELKTSTSLDQLKYKLKQYGLDCR